MIQKPKKAEVHIFSEMGKRILYNVFSEVTSEEIGKLEYDSPVIKEVGIAGKFYLMTIVKNEETRSIYIYGSDISQT